LARTSRAAEFMLVSGVRRKELVTLRWDDIHWNAVGNARRGFIHIRGTKSKNSNRKLSLTQRAYDILLRQRDTSKCEFVFVAESNATQPSSPSGLDHAHARIRRHLKLPTEFVLHSLRHTFATRLGEAGADAFTIMRIMGHSSVTVSQRYVHPTADSVERAFEYFEAAAMTEHENASKTVPTIVPTVAVPGNRVIQ